MTFFQGKAAWIAPPDGVTAYHEAGSCMIFRRKFHGKGSLRAAICADSEYRLFCNGIEVAQGPTAGDDLVTFYDEIDLTDFLHEGENELLAQVVSFAGAFPDFYRGGAPMGRMALRAAFILDGEVLKSDGSKEFIGTDEKWEAAADKCRELFRCPGVPCAGPGERYCNHGAINFFPVQVIEPGFSENNVRNTILRYRLTPAMIPFMRREGVKIAGFFDLDGVADASLQKMLDGQTLTVDAGETADFVLDMGCEITGRVKLEFFRGRCEVALGYSEVLADGENHHFSPEKKHDPITGPMRDEVISRGGKWEWNSFFYRAFRFVRVKVSAGKSRCELRINKVVKEVFPYEWKGSFTGNALYDRFWETGKRTLEACSHLVFEDCPYYERVQYPADSRIGARAAMMLGGDTRLARQALMHFRHSIRENGLTAGSYPSRSPVYLPLWSLHYVAMVSELYRYTGDKAIVEENFSAIGRILEFFLRYRCSDGGIGRLPFWEMADFSTGWLWLGEPPEVHDSASAYVTFFVIESVEIYREMAEILQRSSEADHARCISEELKRKSEIFYDSERELYADTPKGKSFSLLTNAQAVLSGVSGDRTIVDRALAMPDIIPVSPFGAVFVFDALVKCGSMANAAALLERWKKMLINGRTVWPEGTPVPRSECHIWSALPTLALPQLYTGLQILEAGGRKISLSPCAVSDEVSAGSIPLAGGLLKYRFDGRYTAFELPPDCSAILPDGSQTIPGARFQMRTKII